MTSMDIVQLAKNIIIDDLSPMINILQIVGVYIGIFLIGWGIVRLMRHAHANMMYRISPAGTVMAFLAGVVLISFTPELSVLSDSIFGVNQVFTNTCPGGVDGPDGTYFCPILGYLPEINNPPVGVDPADQALKVLSILSLTTIPSRTLRKLRSSLMRHLRFLVHVHG